MLLVDTFCGSKSSLSLQRQKNLDDSSSAKTVKCLPSVLHLRIDSTAQHSLDTRLSLYRLSASAVLLFKMATDLLSVFTGIGLSEQKAKETIKNNAISNNLEQVINDVSTSAILCNF